MNIPSQKRMQKVNGVAHGVAVGVVAVTGAQTPALLAGCVNSVE